jgi:hypothetical protein
MSPKTRLKADLTKGAESGSAQKGSFHRFNVSPEIRDGYRRIRRIDEFDPD